MMLIQEFEQRTGYYPSLAEYAAIEQAYMDFGGDKDAFCKAYKENAGGLAERIQREANQDAIKKEQDQAADISRCEAEISRRDAEIKRLNEMLEKEQEWRPHEMNGNVKQADYEELASCVSSGAARYLTDAEALDWICTEFGFDRSMVTILHEIDAQEINRHNHCRPSGKKIDRRPVYCATDYHYIRFNTGHGEWQWETWNGQIRPFWN